MQFRSRRLPLVPAAVLLAAATGCGAPPAPATLRREVRLRPLPQLTAGHGAVVGVVADSALGYPVVGASVYFTTDPLSDVEPPPARPELPADSTDRNGAFVLAPVAPGTYTVAVRHLGYASERRVVVTRGGVADTLVVRLRGRLRLTR